MPVLDEKLIQNYQTKHGEKEYGDTSYRYMESVRLAISELNAKRVLDYGCGSSTIWRYLPDTGAEILRYDPAIPEIAQKPEGAFDLILNTDVMEHIPEKDVDDVLADIRKSSGNVLFGIACRLDNSYFPDGTPLHCTVKPGAWWQKKIAAHFEESDLIYDIAGFGCVIITWPAKDRESLRQASGRTMENWKAQSGRYSFFPRLARSIRRRWRMARGLPKDPA